MSEALNFALTYMGMCLREDGINGVVGANNDDSKKGKEEEKEGIEVHPTVPTRVAPSNFSTF